MNEAFYVGWYREGAWSISYDLGIASLVAIFGNHEPFYRIVRRVLTDCGFTQIQQSVYRHRRCTFAYAASVVHTLKIVCHPWMILVDENQRPTVNDMRIIGAPTQYLNVTQYMRRQYIGVIPPPFNFYDIPLL